MADTLDQSYEAGAGNEYFGYPGRTYAAQSFTSAVEGRFTKFGFQLKIGAGTPSGTLTGYLYSNNAGAPGTRLATLSNFSASTLTGSYVWYYWTQEVSVAYHILASTIYHMVVGSSIEDAGNYIHIQNGTGYAGGYGHYGDSTPSWTSLSPDDRNFRQYYDTVPVSTNSLLKYRRTRSPGSITGI